MKRDSSSGLKVLHAGIFVDHELGGDIVLAKGLEQNGCQVERFDYRSFVAAHGTEQAQEELLRLSDQTQLLLVGKGEFLKPETLRAAQERGIKTALWFGDLPPQPPQWLLENLRFVDAFFMTSGGPVLRNYHHQGRPGLSAYFLNPSDPELVACFPRPSDQSIDILFTGSFYSFLGADRMAVIRLLSRRHDAVLYGGVEKALWKQRAISQVPLLRRLFKPAFSPRIRGKDYIRAIQQARLGVGVNVRHDVQKYVSDRFTHYLSFGTCFLQWRVPGLELLFDEGKEFVAFEGAKDLSRKIDQLLHDDELRRAIATAGQQKVLSEYNTQNVTAMMLDLILDGSSDRFPWVEVIS